MQMNRTVRVIAPTIGKLAAATTTAAAVKKRVVAYAHVSTDREEQVTYLSRSAVKYGKRPTTYNVKIVSLRLPRNILYYLRLRAEVCVMNHF